MPDPQPKATPKVNKVQQTGRFSGHAVIDTNRKHLEPPELKALFVELEKDPFFYCYYGIAFFFGCRMSEPALILRKEDVSFKDDLIIIRRLKKRNTEAGYQECVYGLTPGLKKLVRTAVQCSKERGLLQNPWLFPSPTKTFRTPKERTGQLRRLESGYSAISRMSAHKAFKKAAQAAGIPENLCHSHTLRHTRATLMLAQGKKPEAVQFLLGHNNIATTMGYIGVANSLRLRYQAEAELGDGFDVVSDQLIRKSRRRTAQLLVSPHGVQDSEFEAQAVDLNLLDDGLDYDGPDSAQEDPDGDL